MGARGHVHPKIRENYFSDNYYVKFGHFSGNNHVKIPKTTCWSKEVLPRRGRNEVRVREEGKGGKTKGNVHVAR